jgi:mobilization protein NikA
VTSEVTNPRAKTMAPWRGRKRVKDARTKLIPPVRCTEEERVAIKAAADQAGLSVGAFVRALALGDAGPRAVRRPPIERKELARLLGHLGKIGSNLNQLAHAFNRDRSIPGGDELNAIRKQVGELRDALMKALGRDH